MVIKKKSNNSGSNASNAQPHCVDSHNGVTQTHTSTSAETHQDHAEGAHLIIHSEEEDEKSENENANNQNVSNTSTGTRHTVNNPAIYNPSIQQNCIDAH